MRIAMAYEPRPGPFGRARPSVAAVFLLPLAAIAFTFANPLVLAGAGAAALVVAAASRALRAALGPLRFAGGLALVIVLVNAVVSQRGETILLRGWELPLLGQVDVSAEALAEGGVLALRILVAFAVFAVWSACVDPDRLLRALRPIASRSALTATLIARLVPLAAADARRLSEAASLRGPAAAPAGRAALARRLIAGSLDRSVDVAATLELRGYGLPAARGRRESRRPLTGEEVLLALTGLTVIGLAATAVLAGTAGFHAYPTVTIDLGPAALLLALCLPALAALPFAVVGRGPALGGPG
jgi:energy-coupling factor transport system permease protein